MIVRKGVPARNKFVHWIPFEKTKNDSLKVCAAYIIIREITENTEKHVSRILQEAKHVFLLITTPPPEPPSWIHGSVSILSLQSSWLDLTPHLMPPGYDTQFFIENFDIPYKRNYAIAHARKHQLQYIFLIDDDIIFRPGIATRAIEVLQKGFTGYGTYSLYYPDKSIVDLWTLSERGGVPEVAISGNCIFLNVYYNLPCFPLIYNEDWFFFQACVELRNLRLFGGESVVQNPPRPKDSQVIAFQQLGEILVDCIFHQASQKRPTLNNICQPEVVDKIIFHHIERLASLAHPWDGLNDAMDAVEAMSVSDIVRYGRALIKFLTADDVGE